MHHRGLRHLPTSLINNHGFSLIYFTFLLFCYPKHPTRTNYPSHRRMPNKYLPPFPSSRRATAGGKSLYHSFASRARVKVSELQLSAWLCALGSVLLLCSLSLSLCSAQPIVAFVYAIILDVARQAVAVCIIAVCVTRRAAQLQRGAVSFVGAVLCCYSAGALMWALLLCFLMFSLPVAVASYGVA